MDFYINLFFKSHTIPEVMEMEKNEEKKQDRKKTKEAGKPENQNQTHNSVREGMGPNTKRKPS